MSIFGEASEVQIPEPMLPVCESWGTMEKLKREKEVVGIYISGHPLDDYKKEMQFFCNSNLNAMKVLPELVGKELTFAGVISSVSHMMSKQNKPWGMFTLEDYDESHEFRMFGEEYLKFRHFLIPNTFVHCKVTVQQGWIDKKTGKPRDPRLSFIQMQQLQDVMQHAAKNLTLEFSLNEVLESKIQTLKEVLDKHTGEQFLYINIRDHEEKIALDMTSRMQKVSVNSELLDMLDNLDITYKVG